MQEARDIDGFIADRFGHYVFGAHYLVWCSDDTLGGMVFWGTPEEKDVIELTRVFEMDLSDDLVAPYDIVADGRRLDRVPNVVFDPFARTAVKRLREQQQKLLRRQAIVVPDGLVGTIMAGFFPLFELQGKYRVFKESQAAFAWLERGDLHDEVEALVTARLGEMPALTELRRWLQDHLVGATVQEAARALGTSSRSLQRELGGASTSFRRELDHARVAAARVRLAETDDKVESIARELGCTTLSGFSRLFRRVTGQSPGEFRAEGHSRPSSRAK
jgi:AraC-like DNA-binding protein